MTDALEAARGIVAAVLQCPSDSVIGSAAIGSLPGWDSIAHVNLVLALEERLGRQLSAEEIASARQVDDFAKLLSASS